MPSNQYRNLLWLDRSQSELCSEDMTERVRHMCSLGVVSAEREVPQQKKSQPLYVNDFPQPACRHCKSSCAPGCSTEILPMLKHPVQTTTAPTLQVCSPANSTLRWTGVARVS